MPEIESQAAVSRRAWITPELQRLRPGDAEFNTASGADTEFQTS